MNAMHAVVSDVATTLLLLQSLAAASAAHQPGAEPAQALLTIVRAAEVAWQLCDSVGTAQALLERGGRFIQVSCLLFFRRSRHDGYVGLSSFVYADRPCLAAGLHARAARPACAA